MSFEDIFDNREKKSYVRARKYDVKITLNKNGHDRFSVRFGFLNDAAKAFAPYDYVQFSNVEKLPGKIYFKLYEDRRYLDCYKLCLNGKKSETNRYAILTPTENGEKIYRSKWVGKEFKIEFDSEHGLYYIDIDGAL